MSTGRPPLLVVALAALVVMIVASLALPFAGWPGPLQAPILAGVKTLVLLYVLVRAARRDVYALQWSSMLVLLFFAEGIVRATTDPAPASWIAFVATLASVVYFAAVLAILRPIKKAAKAARP